ncbi:hypothetical protein DZF91_09895 [Actinomadura logoneensis]|uniref:Uncharacterized protein n=1 Tax=Actinomadura logoneensis TaxID=2293572 RepID=A0A372JPC1_9ACTN|nr:hypothetical protein [Actinomadura logoneensis]RFU41810.1 hypothetical protein DZF91_09895 [Actinomadura logoneensis]
MSEEKAAADDLESLPTDELHDRAVRTARDNRDLRFLWDLLRAIPAAAASLGEQERAEYDMLHSLSLLQEAVHADKGDLGRALRPVYIDYLTKQRHRD